MKRTIALINYDSSSADIYCDQIKNVFSNHINVKKYCVNQEKIHSTIIADLVLVQYNDGFEDIKKYIPDNTQIMFCNRTISTSGYNKILSIPKDTEVFLLDETLEMSRSIISIIYEMGIRNLKLLPVCPKNKKKLMGKTVVILGESTFVPSNAKEIINIGSSLLDISTLIGIAFRLDLDHIICNKDIQKSYSEVVPSNLGLTEILGKINRTEGVLNVLSQVIEEGVLNINTKGQIISYNEKVKKILGIENKALIPGNGIMQFPDIPFKEVLKSRRPIKDKLIKINGYDIILSVDPIINCDRLYGAFAIMKNFSETELKQHKFRSQLIGKGHKAKYNFKDIIGESEEITKCKEKARRMADSNSTVLVTGESGTGKELFAQAIHNNSIRRDYQFVVINCGALPESLLESELFGYEEGSFTGARKGGKPGLFELAHRGTLFFDEIGEMPLSLQSRLLRVIQEREVMRLGGDRLINIDVRLIAATNRNLKEMVSKGQFREDLFYRLNVLSLKVPSLNFHKEDIPSIINKLKEEFKGEFTLTEKAMHLLMQHDWKGNVRELKNYVEYIINLGINIVDAEDLPFYDDEFVNAPIEKKFDLLLKTAGKSMASYILVLKKLEEAFKENRRMGRRSILKECENTNLFISEQEIRTILSNLEKCEMVTILKGRSGTIITELGLNYLKNIKTKPQI